MKATNIIGIENEIFWQAAIPVIIGFAFHKAWEFSRRDRGSQNTPPKASVKFWLWDNSASIVLHGGMWYAIIAFTEPTMDFIAGSKLTPNEIKDIVSTLPTKLVYFVLGWVSAYPLTKLEKLVRDFKKKVLPKFGKK